MVFSIVPWQAFTGLREQHTQRWQAAELPWSSAFFNRFFFLSLLRDVWRADGEQNFEAGARRGA